MMLMSSSIFVPAVEIRADKTPSLRLQAVAFNTTRISATWLIGLGFTLDFPESPQKVYKIFIRQINKFYRLVRWGGGLWGLRGDKWH